ncbi:MAG: hypothetical protein Q7T45_11580 [Bradyrhizobium sp.]|uniref:hypothetical protein n=1 Tax=Bradyrhizobium sp. TaxID=376 RepID=UPI0027190539|nr:hypothetical protein [Bradyrhizobium sp.]MDO8398448.1 hypothetical protein [Bradyrhizobium sp.]
MLIISIILEFTVMIVAVLAARQGRPYLYGLAFTFGAYVFYDLARFLQWGVEGPLLSGLFLIASASALVAVWGLYKDRPR